MRLAQFFFLALFCITALFSCKKDDDENQPSAPQPETYDNYSALKVGNYWIYEYFDVDSMGNATSKNLYDSCYVKNDTIINGNTYYRLVQPSAYFPNQGPFPWYPTELLLRDSLHYIISHRGGILFSSQDFSTVFHEHTSLYNNTDTIYQMIRKMEDKDVALTVPAGTFITSNCRKTYKLYNHWAGPLNYGHEHTRYAKNVGRVSETMPSYLHYMRMGRYVERRLIRYHVQP